MPKRIVLLTNSAHDRGRLAGHKDWPGSVDCAQVCCDEGMAPFKSQGGEHVLRIVYMLEAEHHDDFKHRNTARLLDAVHDIDPADSVVGCHAWPAAFWVVVERLAPFEIVPYSTGEIIALDKLCKEIVRGLGNNSAVVQQLFLQAYAELRRAERVESESRTPRLACQLIHDVLAPLAAVRTSLACWRVEGGVTESELERLPQASRQSFRDAVPRARQRIYGSGSGGAQTLEGLLTQLRIPEADSILRERLEALLPPPGSELVAVAAVIAEFAAQAPDVDQLNQQLPAVTKWIDQFDDTLTELSEVIKKRSTPS